MKYLVLSASMLAVAVAVTGCGEKAGEMAAEKMIEEAIKSSAAESGETVDAKVDVSGGTITISGQGEDGKSVKMNFGEESASIVSEDGTAQMLMGDAAKLPADFPADLTPVYPGIALQMTTKMEEDGVFTVMGTTPDPLDKVAKYYKDKASAGGWTEALSIAQGGQMHMLGYEKDDRMLTVNLISQDGTTTINLTTGNQ